MEIKRIKEMIKCALTYVEESSIASDRSEIIQQLMDKQSSLEKVSNIIDEHKVLLSIQTIVPNFKRIIKVEKEYYDILKKAIIENYNTISDNNNEQLQQKNIPFNKWNDIDTKLSNLRTNLLKLIDHLYAEEKYTTLVETDINKRFYDIVDDSLI